MQSQSNEPLEENIQNDVRVFGIRMAIGRFKHEPFPAPYTGKGQG
jgi:hypothetical protein